MLSSNFVILGVLISAIGGLSYVVYTIQGKVKPNKVTFFLWALAPMIAFASEIKQGVGIQSLLTFSVGFIPLLIFLGSFVNKQAQWKITRFDLICGILSIAGLVFWMETRVGNIAIFFSILADGLAAIPTIRKAYSHPQTERGWPFLTGSISAMITLMTIKTWTFAFFAFPIYIMVVDFIIFAFAKFKVGKYQGR